MTITSTHNKLSCLRQVDDFCSVSFDFLIIGGGTAGLTLANRLSEIENWNIGVLEAGQYLSDDPMVQIPSSYPQLSISPKYTWQTYSVPQKHLNNRTIFMPTGKALGGSSSTNIMLYMRGGKQEYDGWGAMGNPGWSWEELLPYFKKAEHYYPKGITSLDPKKSVEKDMASYIAKLSEFHGSDGPIKVTYTSDPTELEIKVAEAFDSLGIPFNYDQGSGDATGFFPAAKSVDLNFQRCSSVNGYLENIGSRSNLYVLTEATVSRVLFEEGSDPGSQLKATGVEFIYKDIKYTANARKEVIISGGALKTPQILELSGIGDGARLTAQGVPLLLDLPSVGENLMDHFAYYMRIKLKDTSIALKPGEISRPIPAASFCPLHYICPPETTARLKEIFEGEMNSDQLTPLQKAQYQIQRKYLDEAVGISEFVVVGVSPMTAPDVFRVTPILQHPVARGSVHIKSRDPFTSSDVDLRCLDNTFDFEVLKEMIKFTGRLFKSEILSEYFLEYIQPAGVQSFDSLNDEDFKNIIAKHLATCFHPVGTAVMAPRDLGGVVDPSLKVYGTTNLRVVDASIFPLHVACHLQASVYAIAEKAADIIKGDNA